MPRKTLKRQYITARVDAATKSQIEAIAHDERRTLSQVIAILVEQALQARKSKEQAA